MFLSLTAALLASVPDSLHVLFKLTIAAFVSRPQLAIPPGACLYVDEVSMVPPHLMDVVMARARGRAVLCTGDVFQIQPIPIVGATHQWFFEAREFARRKPTITVVREQHRLTGDQCADVRSLLESVASQSAGPATWKSHMNDFVLNRTRKVAPPQAVLIVFSNDQIRSITTAWAKEGGHTLDKHGLCVALPVTITANKIASSSDAHVTYEYRNGDRGIIEHITDSAVRVRVGTDLVTVQNAGIGGCIPQVKSSLAQTADAAQGKTITDPVHVVFPTTFFPHPARILVSLSRSKVVTFSVPDRVRFDHGLREASFDNKAVAYAAQAE